MKVKDQRASLDGTVNADLSGSATAGLTLGDYSLSVSKRNDINNIDSMEISISSMYGEQNGSIVPIGTPWAMLVLNPRGTNVVQAICRNEPSSTH